MNNKKLTIDDLKTGQIPEQILEQLRVLNRVSFPLKSTSVSAYSKSESMSDSISDNVSPELPPNQNVGKEIDRLVNEVAEMEDLVKQLEDSSDELLKDMNIPFENKMISDAVKTLDPSATSITKDVLDKAMAIMDYFPLMTLGQDPVLAALTGDGSIDGPWMNCSEITKSFGDLIKQSPKDKYEAENIVKDKSIKVADDFEKKQNNMQLEIILMTWWNIIWPKFLVDLGIINPARLIVANPVDKIIGFFMKRKFRVKSEKWCKENGPINRILNKMRKFLICVIPPKAYPRYNPMIDDKDFCKGIQDNNCPQTNTLDDGQEIDAKGKTLESLSDMIEGADDKNACVDAKKFLENFVSSTPEGLGASPECAKAAKIVLDAVMADALTPKEPINKGTKISQLIKNFNGI